MIESTEKHYSTTRKDKALDCLQTTEVEYNTTH